MFWSTVLKPIELSTDRKRLAVGLFWLSDGDHAWRSLQVPPTPPTDTYSSVEGTGLIHKLDGPTSGDVISFTTHDPQKLPLPSFDLLDMQWALHRVTALSGAADATDEELDPDDGLCLPPPISVKEGVAMILSEMEREQQVEDEESLC